MKPTLRNAEQEITRRVRELSQEQMQLCQRAGGWTRQQVVEHLILAQNGTAAELERRMERGPTVKPRTLRDRFNQFVVITVGYFPPGRTSPEIALPERSELPRMDGSGVAAAYEMSARNVSEMIERTEAKFGRRATLCTHPILGPLSGPQWRKFHAIHALHHCEQLDRILADSIDS